MGKSGNQQESTYLHVLKVLKYSTLVSYSFEGSALELHHLCIACSWPPSYGATSSIAPQSRSRSFRLWIYWSIWTHVPEQLHVFPKHGVRTCWKMGAQDGPERRSQPLAALVVPNRISNTSSEPLVATKVRLMISSPTDSCLLPDA